MPAPEVGKPLPRAEDAFVEDQKWHGYVLAESGHGTDWHRRFGDIDSETLWSIIADAVVNTPVDEVRVDGFGTSCRVPVVVTLNARTARVRTVWYYDYAGSAPRLITAFPTT